MVAGLFLVVYTFFLWGGISNLVGVLSAIASIGFSPGGGIWAIVIGYCALPVLMYGIALLIGMRQRVLARVLIYLGGVGVTGALSITLLALFNAYWLDLLV